MSRSSRHSRVALIAALAWAAMGAAASPDVPAQRIDRCWSHDATGPALSDLPETICLHSVRVRRVASDGSERIRFEGSPVAGELEVWRIASTRRGHRAAAELELEPRDLEAVCGPHESTSLRFDFELDAAGRIVDSTDIRVSGVRVATSDTCHDLTGTREQVFFRRVGSHGSSDHGAD